MTNSRISGFYNMTIEERRVKLAEAVSPAAPASENLLPFTNGGLSSEAIIRLVLEGNRVKSEERIPLLRRVRDIVQAPDGAVLVLVDGKDGDLLRLTPAAR